MTLTATRTAQPFWPRNTLASTVTAVGDALTTTTGQAQSITVIRVTATSALTLTSAPTLHAGFQGQPMEIMNVGSNVLTLQDETQVTGSLLKFGGYPRINIGPNQSIHLSYVTDGSLNKWVLVSSAAGLAPGTQSAHPGGGQGSASPLLWPTNLITSVGTEGDSVKMWSATGSGMTVRVINTDTKRADLFPASTEAFDDMTNNQQISIDPGTGVTLLDGATAKWRIV